CDASAPAHAWGSGGGPGRLDSRILGARSLALRGSGRRARGAASPRSVVAGLLTPWRDPRPGTPGGPSRLSGVYRRPGLPGVPAGSHRRRGGAVLAATPTAVGRLLLEQEWPVRREQPDQKRDTRT